jgi:hypothetical protein
LSQLSRLVELDATISPKQAELAVATVLRFLALRLPSPVVGQISDVLAGDLGDERRDEQ